MSRQPSTYYRYRMFDTRTLESLCNDTLYFASPKTFNDPLDCAPTVHCDSDVTELRNLLTSLMKSRVKVEILNSLRAAKVKISPAAEAHAERQSDSSVEETLGNIRYFATDVEYGGETDVHEEYLLTSQIKDELRQHYERGVCCFSTTYNNPLLWSHYGGQHEGICIGYGLNRLPKPQLRKVIYGGDRLIRTSTLAKAFVSGDPAAKKTVEDNVLLRKATGWRYEREWRMIGPQGVQPSGLFLKEITFGLRCPHAVVHTVVSALKRREDRAKGVVFYRVFNPPHSYALTRRKIDLDDLRDFPIVAESGEEAFNQI